MVETYFTDGRGRAKFERRTVDMNSVRVPSCEWDKNNKHLYCFGCHAIVGILSVYFAV